MILHQDLATPGWLPPGTLQSATSMNNCAKAPIGGQGSGGSSGTGSGVPMEAPGLVKPAAHQVQINEE